MKQPLILSGVITLLLLVNVGIALADATPVPPIATGVPYWGPLVSCTGGDPYTYQSGNQTITIPTCTSICDGLVTAKNIIYFGITIALFVLAPIFFLWGGIIILTAGGDTGRHKQGREILLRVVIGVAVALLAFLIVKTVLDILGINVNGFNGQAIECKLAPVQQ